jgi:hypothetical protein
MKRIYLTGAAILLFIILGINYYHRKDIPVPIDNAASAQTTNITPIAIDNAPVAPTTVTPPAPANRQIELAQNTSHTWYGYKKKNSDMVCHPRHHAVAQHKTTHHYVAKTHTTKTKAAPACAVVPLQLPATTTMHSSPVILDVQVTKEYTGNRPRPVQFTRIITLQHKARKHYAGPGIGIELGGNENGFHHNNTSDIQTGNFNAGIIMDVKLSDNISFQPVLRYIGKGNALQDEFDVNAREKIKLHYIDLPLDLVCKFGNPTDARFMIGAGPYIAYLAGAEDHFSGGEGGDVVNPRVPLYPTANILPWDWGANGFIGVTAPGGLFLKAGAELGLRDIIKSPLTGEYANRNFSIFISGGFIFGQK